MSVVSEKEKKIFFSSYGDIVSKEIANNLREAQYQ